MFLLQANVPVAAAAPAAAMEVQEAATAAPAAAANEPTGMTEAIVEALQAKAKVNIKCVTKNSCRKA